MKSIKYIFRSILLYFFVNSITFGSSIQSELSKYDLLSPGIFPYYCHLYNKKVSSTLLLFPGSSSNNTSFLSVGKKDRYGTFNDLYVTAQYNGDPNVFGLHIDNIQINNTSDSSNNDSESNLSYHHRYDNKGRFGVWYLTNNLHYLSGISYIVNNAYAFSTH